MHNGNHTIIVDNMTDAERVIHAIRVKSEATGLTMKTIGRKVGQGGQLIGRLEGGARIWPETAATIIERLKEIPDKPHISRGRRKT